MRCSDGEFYVVKFRNNPQHLRVLTNEMLATRLAERADFRYLGRKLWKWATGWWSTLRS